VNKITIGTSIICVCIAVIVTLIFCTLLHINVDHVVTKKTLVTLTELCNTHEGVNYFSIDRHTATVYCSDGEEFSTDKTNQGMYNTKNE